MSATDKYQVLSEIDQPRKKFRKGVLIAVGTMCVLYMLVNVAYVSNVNSYSVPDRARLTPGS